MQWERDAWARAYKRDVGQLGRRLKRARVQLRQIIKVNDERPLARLLGLAVPATTATAAAATRGSIISVTGQLCEVTLAHMAAGCYTAPRELSN